MVLPHLRLYPIDLYFGLLTDCRLYYLFAYHCGYFRIKKPVEIFIVPLFPNVVSKIAFLIIQNPKLYNLYIICVEILLEYYIYTTQIPTLQIPITNFQLFKFDYFSIFNTKV